MPVKILDNITVIECATLVTGPDATALLADLGAWVKLTEKGTPMYSIQDVNGDGRSDMIVHVTTSAFQLTTTDTAAVLKGKTTGGVSIKGTDTVRVVP